MLPQYFNPNSTEDSPDLFNLNAVLEAQLGFGHDEIEYMDEGPKIQKYLKVPQFPDSCSASDEENSKSDSDGRNPNKPKRKRRLSNEINRIYKCEYLGCKKAYEKASHLKTHKILKKHDRN